jgi:hypothetical protein
MRRIVLGGIVAAMAVLLTGCPTAPPGYQPPYVESSEISPQPAQPGDTLTMVLDVRDDGALTAVVPRWVYTPSNTKLAGHSFCDTEMAPQGDFRRVLVTVTCLVPSYASNGTWQLDLFLNDSSYPSANSPGPDGASFEVTGGSGPPPPQLVSYRIDPTTWTGRRRSPSCACAESMPIAVGSDASSSFNFTKLFAQNSTYWCRNPVATPVSATEVDVVAACTPSNYWVYGRAEPGLHLSYMQVTDALGHEGNAEMYVDVQPGP